MKYTSVHYKDLARRFVFILFLLIAGAGYTAPIGVFPDGKGNNNVYGPLQQVVIGETGVETNGGIRTSPTTGRLQQWLSESNVWVNIGTGDTTIISTNPPGTSSGTLEAIIGPGILSTLITNALASKLIMTSTGGSVRIVHSIPTGTTFSVFNFEVDTNKLSVFAPTTDVDDVEYPITNRDVFGLELTSPDSTVIIGHEPSLHYSKISLKTRLLAGPPGANGANLLFAGDWSPNGILGDANNNIGWPSNCIVAYGGSTYYTLLSVPAGISAPNIQASPIDYWKLFVAAGEDGVVGSDMKWAGEFRSLDSANQPVEYYSNQVVSSGYNLYIAKTNFTSVQSGTPSALSQPNPYWQLIVTRGTDGVNGYSVDGMFWIGPYSSATTYEEGSVVSQGRSLYVATQHIDGVVSPVITSPGAGWYTIFTAASDGSPGAPGVPGIGNMRFVGQWNSAVTYSTNDVVYAYRSIGSSVPDGKPEIFYCTYPNGGTNDLAGVQPVGDSTYAGIPSVQVWKRIGTSGQDAFQMQYQYLEDFIAYKAYSNALVIYNDAVYFTVNPNEYVPPAANPLNTAYWRKLVENGQDGQDGQDGLNGQITSNLVYMGQYQTGYTYASNSIVTYSNIAWHAKTDVSSAPTSTSEYWQVFAGFSQLNQISMTSTTPGPAGAIGPQGSQGVAGVSATFIGSWTSTNVYVSSNMVEYLGSTYYSYVDDNSNNIPTNAAYWKLFVSKGADGNVGSAGSNATISIGSVTTVTNLPASVSNSGNSVTAVFDFKIPKGDQGPIGPSGANLILAGIWSNAVQYSSSSIVYHAGSSYYTLQASSNQSPSTNTLVWQLLAAQGQIGATGLQGPTGPTGQNGTNGFTPYIDSASSNWFINGIDTGYPSRGERGDVGPTSTNYYDFKFTGTHAFVTAGLSTNNAQLVPYGSTTTSTVFLVASNGIPYIRSLYDIIGMDLDIRATNHFMNDTNNMFQYTNMLIYSPQLKKWINTTNIPSSTVPTGPAQPAQDLMVYVSSTYTASPNEHIIVDTTASDVLIFADNIVANSGKVFNVYKKVDPNLVLISTLDGSTVHMTTTVGISRAKNSITLISDGVTNWMIR